MELFRKTKELEKYDVARKSPESFEGWASGYNCLIVIILFTFTKIKIKLPNHTIIMNTDIFNTDNYLYKFI